MKFKPVATKQFRKDLKRLKKSGYPLEELKQVIDLLANDEVLPDQYYDHPIRGRYQGARECHIGPDWLLMYAKEEKTLILFLLRTGTHRDILGIE